jgi:hypothetical protein
MDDEDSAHEYKRPFVVQAPVAAALPLASRESSTQMLPPVNSSILSWTAGPVYIQTWRLRPPSQPQGFLYSDDMLAVPATDCA